MNLENCPKCTQKLIFLRSSNHFICRSCEKIYLHESLETEQLEDSKVKTYAKLIPVEIEIIDSKFKKVLGWSSITEADDTLIASSLKTIMSFATQNNKRKFQYIIGFSNEMRKVVECDAEDLLPYLIVWSWRIKEKKTEKNFVTFGIDFSQLKRDMVISKNQINKNLCLYIKPLEESNVSEDLQIIQLRQRLIKILKTEIFRYFFEQRNDMVMLEATSEGLKIPSKANERSNIVLGLGILVFIFGGCVANFIYTEPAYNYNLGTNSKNSQYIDSVIDRSGVGRTIDSAQELVNACKVMARDKGMTRSQANKYCN